ncbi:hypothetical protein [Nocardioides litoris]|uniref:hypothetical protein n=1 Tax=Nocardioides litoris TaxID=1926648 RepID=UPI0011248A7D|nr:hypothetical protein [Nocardioides litoris]
MESSLYLGFDGPGLPALVAQVVVWLVVVGAGLLAVRRTWGLLGLAGGVLGAGVAVTVLVDAVLVRRRSSGASVDDPGSNVLIEAWTDLPGFIVDRGWATELAWAQALAVGLVAASLVLAALAHRRREHGAPDAG